MEVLGFIDTPAVATMAGRPMVSGRSSASNLADLAPHDVALVRRHTRWGRLIWVLVAGTALGVGAFQLWQRPLVAAEATREALIPALAATHQSITSLPDITAPEVDPTAVNDGLLALDNDLRALLDAGSTLPDGPIDTLVAEAVDDAAAAHRLYSTAYTYRVGLLPALSSPTLESDPALTTLEEAAAAFAQWLAGYGQAIDTLPRDVSPEIYSALSNAAGHFATLQGDYLDSLADDDPIGASAALQAIDDELQQLETLLFDYLTATQSTVDELTGEVGSALDEATSLLG
jgi:hypothetical protein